MTEQESILPNEIKVLITIGLSGFFINGLQQSYEYGLPYFIVVASAIMVGFLILTIKIYYDKSQRSYRRSNMSLWYNSIVIIIILLISFSIDRIFHIKFMFFFGVILMLIAIIWFIIRYRFIVNHIYNKPSSI